MPLLPLCASAAAVCAAAAGPVSGRARPSLQMKSVVEGWPGAISVVEVEDQEIQGLRLGAVVDGQHRLGAAQKLHDEGKLLEPLQRMLVEVYPPMDNKDIRSLFVEINKATHLDRAETVSLWSPL